MTSIVIYAKDLERLAGFYARVLDLGVSEEGAGFVTLADDDTELTLVRIPDGYAESIVMTEPPARRSDTPIKPIFTVQSLEAVRSVVHELGGVLDLDAPAWTWRGLRRMDAVDPEGNVVQLCEPAAG